MMIICHACQAQVSDDAACPQCGAAKKVEAPRPGADVFPPPGTPGWLWWAGGAAVLVAWALLKTFVK